MANKKLKQTGQCKRQSFKAIRAAAISWIPTQTLFFKGFSFALHCTVTIPIPVIFRTLSHLAKSAQLHQILYTTLLYGFPFEKVPSISRIGGPTMHFCFLLALFMYSHLFSSSWICETRECAHKSPDYGRLVYNTNSRNDGRDAVGTLSTAANKLGKKGKRALSCPTCKSPVGICQTVNVTGCFLFIEKPGRHSAGRCMSNEVTWVTQSG